MHGMPGLKSKKGHNIVFLCSGMLEEKYIRLYVNCSFKKKKKIKQILGQTLISFLYKICRKMRNAGSDVQIRLDVHVG